MKNRNNEIHSNEIRIRRETPVCIHEDVSIEVTKIDLETIELQAKLTVMERRKEGRNSYPDLTTQTLYPFKRREARRKSG